MDENEIQELQRKFEASRSEIQSLKDLIEFLSSEKKVMQNLLSETMNSNLNLKTANLMFDNRVTRLTETLSLRDAAIVELNQKIDKLLADLKPCESE